MSRLRSDLSVVTYHYVRNFEAAGLPRVKGVGVEYFKAQVWHLKRKYEPIKIRQLQEALEGKKRLPSKAALLTFDDGYLDHYRYVYPILREQGVEGVFFIPVKAVVKREALDVNKIQFILASTENIKILHDRIFELLDSYRDEYKIDSNRSLYAKLAVPGRFDGAEVKFVKNLLQYGLEGPVRHRIVNELFAQFVGRDERDFADGLYMTVEQVRELQRGGMHIGSHGYDHVWLDSLSEERQIEEVETSMGYFERLGIDRGNWVMCYPYGAYNETTIRVLMERGCNLAFTTVGGVVNMENQNRFELPRIDTNDIKLKAGSKKLEIAM